MNKSITFSEKNLKGNSLLNLAYKDYIAARFLLNNRFVIQGITLASTAVEKYLKALIFFTSKEKEKLKFHLNNFDKIKDILSKNEYDITGKLDTVFLDILQKGYEIRYYDEIEDPIIIGFFINQFIGELDDTINFLETCVMKTQNDTAFRTSYGRAINDKDPNLYQNNFILNKQNKKVFMERPDDGFYIEIFISSGVNSECIVWGEGISNHYNGCISVFKGLQHGIRNLELV